jgi:tight adherence protein C
MDEKDHRCRVIVALATATTVLLLGWQARPKPRARAAPRRRARVSRWTLVVPAVAIIAVAPLVALASVAALVTSRRWSAVRRAARAARQASMDYPDALDLLVLTIRAGYVPAQAVVEVVPFLPPATRGAFTAVDQAMNDGARFGDALGQLSMHLGPMAQPLVDSLSAADRYGLPLAPVLERLAFEARQQRRRDTDASARELPVRMAVPLVLCTLPSFVLLAIVPLLLGALSSLRS